MKGVICFLVVIAVFTADPCFAAKRYVDPRNPAARNTGDGALERPYRTLSYAMTQLQPGDTLTIAGGVYRETLRFPARTWSLAATRIQPAAGETVLIKGSDIVTGWSPRGGGVFARYVWTVNSQQVFVDGVALQQIGGTVFGGYPTKADHPLHKVQGGSGGIWRGRIPGGLAEMTDYSFYYDAGAQALYIKVPFSSLDGRTVEVSVRTHLLFGEGLEKVTLRKLSFQHSNTTAVTRGGAITLFKSNRNVLDSLEVFEADGVGFDISGDENTIKHNRAKYCGQLGMKVRGRANTLTYNDTSYNNTRGFTRWWEAGGAKFTGEGGLRDSSVSRHRATGNNGDGIWFDWMNTNNRVYESIAVYNHGHGIHYEASQKGYIFDNYTFGNALRGIYLPHSSGSIVAFNMVANNGYEGIAIIDEGRSPSNALLRPRGNVVHGNIIAWNGRAALVLPQARADNTANFNLYLGDTPPAFSLGWHPLIMPLKYWRSASGQDLDSWSLIFGIPTSLRGAFSRKESDLVWTPVRSVAARYTAPSLAGTLPQSGAHSAVPGPEWQ